MTIRQSPLAALRSIGRSPGRGTKKRYPHQVAALTSFNEFVGNDEAVQQLRASIAAGRLPHSLILSGAAGAGKYTLAIMLAQALNCERQPREMWSNGQTLASFCGICHNCTRIAEAADLAPLVEAAVAAREEMRETDKKETRVLIQTHPDVLVIPPDPPQLLIKLGQVRKVISSAQRTPSEGPRKVFLFTSAQFMKEAANSLLKVLEEPPDFAHLILLAENPDELLPTIRSRCGLVRLGAIPAEELEMVLAERRPEWKPTQRALVARLSQGAVGKAVGFDVAAYTAARADAMVMLRGATLEGEHSELFRMTETYRAGAEGQQKTSTMLSAMASVLEDLLMLTAGTPERLRNVDLRSELETMAAAVDFGWIERAVHGMDKVRSGMRRNLLRSLALDSFAEEMSGVRR